MSCDAPSNTTNSTWVVPDYVCDFSGKRIPVSEVLKAPSLPSNATDLISDSSSAGLLETSLLQQLREVKSNLHWNLFFVAKDAVRADLETDVFLDKAYSAVSQSPRIQDEPSRLICVRSELQSALRWWRAQPLPEPGNHVVETSPEDFPQNQHSDSSFQSAYAECSADERDHIVYRPTSRTISREEASALSGIFLQSWLASFSAV